MTDADMRFATLHGVKITREQWLKLATCIVEEGET
jgi:hypothetical protein